MFALIDFIKTSLPEMFATDTFICVSSIFLKDTLVLLNKKLVVFERWVPVIVMVSLALPKDVLNDVRMG